MKQPGASLSEATMGRRCSLRLAWPHWSQAVFSININVGRFQSRYVGLGNLSVARQRGDALTDVAATDFDSAERCHIR